MKKAKKILKNYGLSIFVPVFMILLILLISPESRSWNAVGSLLKQAFAPAILGFSVIWNFKVGNWDFSVGARIYLASIVAGHIAQDYNLGVLGMCVIAMALSILLALILRVMYYYIQIPTLILTMGYELILESITRLIYNGAGVHLNQSYMILGKFPYNFIIFVLSFVLAYILYYRRKAGYVIRAAGNNANVALTNGIDVKKAKMLAILISGVFAGIYCILSISTSGVVPAVASTMGSSAMVFDAMMCALIGMSINGQGNMIFSLYAGAIATQVLKMGMMAVGLPTNFNKIVIGIVVVILMVAGSRAESFAKAFSMFKRKKALTE